MAAKLTPSLLSGLFFLRGRLKSVVYENPIDSDEDLVARTALAAINVRKMQNMFEKVNRVLHRRFNSCFTTGGSFL